MTEPAPGESGEQTPLSQHEKRARVGATVAAIAVAAVVTSIVLGIGIAALLAAGGGATDDLAVPATTAAGTSAETTAAPAPLIPSSVPSVPSPAPTTTPQVMGTAGEANKEAKEAPPKVEVVAGECVSGFGEKEVLEAACGSAQSRYKVSALGAAGSACPSDTDSSHTIAEYTLCLDIDWVVGTCMDVSGEEPQRAECRPGGVQVISILPETNSVNACPSADSGFAYDERRFVVCFAEL